MSDRLSPLDASFLLLESSTTPMHVGALSVFARPRAGLDYETLLRLIEARIGLVPRYRQKLRPVPGGLAHPVWVDDADFDISYHVRRSALPRPGSDAQLHDLAARLTSRRLDRTRPLWEMYLVEGLERGRIAIITKTHQAMVDGHGALEIGQVMLDVTPRPRAVRGELWMPRAVPGPLGMVAGAVTDLVHQPAGLVGALRWATRDVGATAGRAADLASDLVSVVRTAAAPAPSTPLNVPVSRHRRFAVARTRLEDYRAVRSRHGGTVNDVVLAVVSGAMRTWLLSRGESVTASTMVRALVPMSVAAEVGGPDTGAVVGSPGSQVRSFLLDLPAGEANPVVRLSQVSHATRAHSASSSSVGAQTLARMTGFAPPTLHAVGARLAGTLSRRSFNVLVTNVPGPQLPLYAAGAKLLEMYPVVPLSRRHALTIGLTSYDGGVYFGLNADRDAMGDVAALATMIEESLEELVDTVPR